MLPWSEIRPLEVWRFPDCIATTCGVDLNVGDLLPRHESVYEFSDCVRRRQVVIV